MNDRVYFDWSALAALADTATSTPRLVGDAAAELSALQRRRRRLSTDHVCDTQWAILLEIFVADTLGYQVSVTQLIPVSGVPQSTLLRHLDALEAKGLIAKQKSETDRRVTLARIAPAGRDVVAAVLAPAHLASEAA